MLGYELRRTKRNWTALGAERERAKSDDFIESPNWERPRWRVESRERYGSEAEKWAGVSLALPRKKCVRPGFWAAGVRPIGSS